ncbi:MAG: transglycosylase SLT domain-containing protein [Chloroflexi bacterium]|nr:transglycosylase SLT domain-containing protein [Chloroflexota bacterium]
MGSAAAPSPAAADPGTLLAEAQALQHAGAYEEAAARYRAVIGGRPDASQAAEARFNLAVVAHLSGDYAAAADAFIAFRARHLGHPLMDVALFWLAASYRRSHRPGEALPLYQEYARRHPEVQDHVLLLHAGLLMERRDYAGALEELAQVAASSPSEDVAWQARRLQAETLLASGDYPGAAVAYGALYREAQTPWVRAELLSQRAEALRLAGRAAEQRQVLAEVVRSYPRTPQAASAVEALLRAGAPAFTPYQEGRVYYHQREDGAALRAFQRQRETLPASAETPWARYYTALVNERFGRNLQALQELEETLTFFPTHPAAEEVLWERSWLLGELGRHREAAAAYRAFREQYPASGRAAEAQFKEGLSFYKAGDIAAAEKVWGGADARGESALLRGRSALWQAKARSALGDQARARLALSSAAQAQPDRYYGLRARALLEGAATQRPPAGAPLSGGVTQEDEREAVAWLAERADWALDPATLAATEAQSGSDPRVRRASLLAELGLWEAATQEYRDAVQQARWNPAALYALGRLLNQRGQHSPAILATSILLERLGVSPSPGLPAGQAGLPRLFLKLLYPQPFSDQVTVAARQQAIDPLLLQALVRQESLYSPRATSGAGARGLTQVMPSTGREIAQGLGLGAFDPDDLYRPLVSLRFGAFYLARQLRELDQEPVFALAAYNGGPGNALRWRGRTGGADPDLFLEEIDYEETALYVRLVMENYAYYQMVYRPPTAR